MGAGSVLLAASQCLVLFAALLSLLAVSRCLVCFDGSPCLLVFATAQCLVLFVVAYAARRHVEDEQHHVPQGLQYCRGNLRHWDPKITTPPGLYLGSALAALPGRLWGARPSLTALRAVNSLFLLLAVGLDSTRHLPVALMPILYVYSLLYYTDVGGLCWLLLAARLAASHRLVGSALVRSTGGLGACR